MEAKEKLIGTDTYKVVPMDAVSALKVQTKLLKILGRGTLSFLSKGFTDASKHKITADNLSTYLEKMAHQLIPELMNNFDDEDVNQLIIMLFEKNVFVKEKNTGGDLKCELGKHFIGKAFDIWKVASFILEVNFNLGKFIKSLLPIIKQEEVTKDNLT